MLTIENINNRQVKYSLISKTKLRGNNSKPHYRLDKPLSFKLSNDIIINIPKGFEWDLSSVPRIFWSILPTDGDFEIAYLIHDYLYIEKDKMYIKFEENGLKYTRKFADDEMLKWAKVVNGTKNISLRNLDNLTRWFFVRIFGNLVWRGIIKIK